MRNKKINIPFTVAAASMLMLAVIGGYRLLYRGGIEAEIAEVWLMRGSSGEQVERVQNVLAELGLFTGDADGSYGEDTVDAVKRFQSYCGIEQTGFCDAVTLALLGVGSGGEEREEHERLLLARMITAEAGDAPYIIQLSVGGVAVSRARSGLFGSTLATVICRPGAFPGYAAAPGTAPTESSVRAADAALLGMSPADGALFWRGAGERIPDGCRIVINLYGYVFYAPEDYFGQSP